MPLPRQSSIGLCKLRQDGFALVVAISLMGFLFLLLAVISVQVRVDLGAANGGKVRELAKQNAVFGLQMAVAELQTSLGPDQRASARADIVNELSGTGAKYWTGVWKGEESEDFASREQISWLVSGDIEAVEDPVSVLADSDPVKVFPEVEVPREALPATGMVAVPGNFAWWVGDEGVKVRYNLKRAEDRSRLASEWFSSPGRFGIEALGFMADIGVASESITEEVNELMDFSQIPLLYDALENMDRHHLHDITFSHKGVLADSLRGGLRKDLTELFEGEKMSGSVDNDPDLPDWALLQGYYQSHRNLTPSSDGIDGVYASSVETDSAKNGVFPVVSRIEFNWGVLPFPKEDLPEGEEGWDFVITMRPLIVLSNFTDVHIDPADYIIEYVAPTSGDSPRILFQFVPSKVASSNLLIAYDEMFGGGAGDTLTFTIKDQGFAPGESRIFSLNVSAAIEFPTSKELEMQNDDDLPQRYAYIPTGIDIDLNESTEPKVLVKTRMGYHGLKLYANGYAVQEINDLFVAEVNQANSNAVSLLPAVPGAPLETTQSFLQGHQGRIRLKTPDGNINNERPAHSDKKGGHDRRGFSALANSNLRARMGGAPARADYLWDGNPVFKHLRDHNSSPLETLDDQRVDTWGGEIAPMFHIPSEPLLSLAQLQHANVGSFAQPSYVVGHSWGDPFVDATDHDIVWKMNRALWDQYYFSGKENGPDGESYRNSRLLEVVEGEDLEISQRFLLDGAFNVNSTSVEAWKAVLSSLKALPVEYYDYDDGRIEREENLTSHFLRSPLPFGEAVDNFSASLNSAAHEKIIRRGYRSLSDEQITNLAGQIVYQIKNRGPFLSLASFVNRDPNGVAPSVENPYSSQNAGVIQSAIDWPEAVEVDGVTYEPTGINSRRFLNWVADDRVNPAAEGDNSMLPNYEAALGTSRLRNAPGYFTQADILTAIGGSLSARSDTFVIRSYGNVVDPLSGAELSVAYCEAVVQRVPEPVVPDLVNQSESAAVFSDTLGRRFKLAAFRWINEGDI